ncbi:MAG: arylsulfatase [Bacteroidales bacterium]|nr:arylsulfatase [Bacteroidales bacterium]
MKRTLFLLSIAIACITGCQQTPETKPNIIFILADDLGYGELGCYGQELIQTPNVDNLAAEGMRFTNFYSGSPVCAPSRCVLLTGLHTGHSFVRDNYEMGGYLDEEEGGQLPLPPGTQTLARLFKENGYATGAIGKWGLGGPESTGLPTRQGFDFFYGYLCQKQAHNYYPSHLWRNEEWDTLANGYFPQHQEFEGDPSNLADFEKYKGPEYAQDLMAGEALQFIREHKDDPFFLYLPFPVPHLALQVPDESLQMYLGKFEEEPYLGENGYLPHPYPKSAYAGMITRMDMHIGQIMDLLNELGLDDNTVVMFSSDNGATFLDQVDTELFDSHAGLRGHKGNLYEGGIRVPFIVKLPGHTEPGRVSNYIGSFQDVMPTLLEIAGIEAPHYLDGISLLPEISGHEQRDHGFLYWEYRSGPGWQAVRKDDWKAIRKGIRNDPGAPMELYNLKDDFSEQHDLAEEYPGVIERMEELMKNARVPSSYFPLAIDSIN